MCHRMHMADGHKAGVVDLLANHPKCSDDGLPRWVDVWGFAQKQERRLETRRQALRRRGGQPQTICMERPRGEVAEFYQILRGYMQDLTPSVKFRDGRCGNRVGYVAPIGQPAQYAGVDEHGHHSYSPSLLRA